MNDALSTTHAAALEHLVGFLEAHIDDPHTEDLRKLLRSWLYGTSLEFSLRNALSEMNPTVRDALLALMSVPPAQLHAAWPHHVVESCHFHALID
jgi:hypothetical protein